VEFGGVTCVDQHCDGTGSEAKSRRRSRYPIRRTGAWDDGSTDLSVIACPRDGGRVTGLDLGERARRLRRGEYRRTEEPRPCVRHDLPTLSVACGDGRASLRVETESYGFRQDRVRGRALDTDHRAWARLADHLRGDIHGEVALLLACLRDRRDGHRTEQAQND